MMTAPDLFRARPREYLPGHLPSLDGPSRNDWGWADEGRAAGLYSYGKSDPRYWPEGIRQVTAEVTQADITAGQRTGINPVAAAARRALRLPPAAGVEVFGDWFRVTLGAVTEWHDLPEAGAVFTRSWSRSRRGRPFEFTFSTTEDWAVSEEAGHD